MSLTSFDKTSLAAAVDFSEDMFHSDEDLSLVNKTLTLEF
jgi:hypothetical protein